jgi:hypothetical protein
MRGIILYNGTLLRATYILLWTLLTYITYPLETLHYLLSSMPWESALVQNIETQLRM